MKLGDIIQWFLQGCLGAKYWQEQVSSISYQNKSLFGVRHYGLCLIYLRLDTRSAVSSL